jgi:hypothetical protein
MKVIEATYRKENGRTRVNLKFKTMDQLLDPDDPSPLPQKELTPEAEDAILSNAFAGKLKMPLTLDIQIPEIPEGGSAADITQAIRHHFRYVLTGHVRDTAIFIRERRTALALTGFNLLLALIYVGYTYQHPDWQTTIAGIFIGGLVIIMNWATVWDTYEFFIFDGREKSQRKKLLNKIIDAEINVILYPKDA